MADQDGDKKPLLTDEKVIGNGSFGVVFQAKLVETGEIVAVKKNRELQIMQQLKHTNVVQLKSCFYSKGDKPDEVYLNLVLEFVPETIYRIVKHYSRTKRVVPGVFIKVARALAYIHQLGICHRDIKPQNLLLDPQTHAVKLCDFGSAKMLVKGEANIAYICSRYYRAPELIFGATDYTTAIDTWSYGCVFAELMLGQPLFPGESNVDQLVEIIKVVGTPTREEIQCMNPNYTEFRFPQIKAHPWAKARCLAKAHPDAIDLISKLLQYIPEKRITPMQSCAHAYFDELRDPNLHLPNMKLPPLFDFTPEEMRAGGELMRKLVPPHYQGQSSGAASSSERR
eukprot:118769-Hanusia_phi.AAC.3